MPSAELEKAMQIWRETGAALGQKTYLWEMRFGFEEMWARFSRPPQDVKYEPVGAVSAPNGWCPRRSAMTAPSSICTGEAMSSAPPIPTGRW
jgi:hypothetical protein